MLKFRASKILRIYYAPIHDYNVSYVQRILDTNVDMEVDLPILRSVHPNDIKKFQHQALYISDVSLLDIKQALNDQTQDVTKKTQLCIYMCAWGFFYWLDLTFVATMSQ